MITKKLLAVGFGFFLAGSTGYSQVTIAFEFDTGSPSIGGSGALGSSFRSAVNGNNGPIVFDLGSLFTGLTLTITESQTNISNINAGLGLDTGGTFSAVGDSLEFSFNRPTTLDFLDMGSFTGTGLVGEDAVSISFSNSNPTINLVNGDFDNNGSDTISLTTNNFLSAGESFFVNYVDGDFSLEGFDATVIPEPSTYALIFGGMTLGVVLIWKRRGKGSEG